MRELNTEEIEVVYEDEDVLILNKPSGLTVNKSDTTKDEETVQDWVERRTQKLGSYEPESDFNKRAGIVHRLDKETSGILIIAKNAGSFENLQKQFKERSVKKRYIALAHGKVEPKTGEIKALVGRLPWNRKRFGVMAGGRESITFYKTLGLFKNPGNGVLTLLELEPKTGRTHQIRVHLKHINHPIFADPLYSGRKTSRLDRKFLGRLFLHAKYLSFTHPKTEIRMELEAPLPSQLDKFLSSLSALDS